MDMPCEDVECLLNLLVTQEFGLTTRSWLITPSLVHDVLVQFGIGLSDKLTSHLFW